ncbi:MAG: NAD(P)/FAD-dependent oxidoreductase [Methanomassiliicoccales archaeon]
MKECDFLVVGGGPVGTTFASETASRAKVVIVEEHEEVGLPVQCTGLVTPRVVEMAQAQDTIINQIRGAYFHFPGGETVEVRSREVKAVVIDRAAFDRRRAEFAIDKGAELHLGTRFLSHEQSGCVLVRCRFKGHIQEFKAKLLVGADGYKSNVAHSAGLFPPEDLVRGLQMDLAYREEEQDMLFVYLGREVAPGFFAWRIPCGEMTRVGLCVSMNHKSPMRYLTSLLKRVGLQDKRRVRVISGMIPLGPAPRTYADRLMLIGDAAGQAKPLSGGGLYTGMVAAHCAAETSLICLSRDDYSGRTLSEYQEKWKSLIGKELERGMLLRRAFIRLSDEKLKEIGRILSRPEVESVLNQGDIDYPMELAPYVLRAAPSLLKFTPSFLGTFFYQPRQNSRNERMSSSSGGRDEAG